MSLLDAWEFLRGAGVPGTIFLALWASWRGIYVWRSEHEAALAVERERRLHAERESNAWREAYLRAATNAGSLVETLAKLGSSGT